MFFIDLREENDEFLAQIAGMTGGEYLKYNEGNLEYLKELVANMENTGLLDTDEDGFCDLEEMMGLVIEPNGKTAQTNYLLPDTHGDELDDNEEVDVELTKVEIPGKQGNPSTFKYYHHMWSDPSLLDSDGDGLDDGEDLFPLEKMTEDKKLLRNFFDSAREFEIYYLAKFCTRFEVSPIECIKYINVYRQFEDYDLYSIQQGLAEIGEKCDISSLKIIYGEYVNYKNGTSWAEIQAQGYAEWYMCFKWFMAEWMWGVSQQLIENAYKVPKDVEENVKFDFSVFDENFDMEGYLSENQAKSTTKPSNVNFEPYGRPFASKTWGDKGEIQAAERLASEGFNVEMLEEDSLGKNLGKGYGKEANTNLDCIVEGKVFDIYSPSTENINTIKKRYLINHVIRLETSF